MAVFDKTEPLKAGAPTVAGGGVFNKSTMVLRFSGCGKLGAGSSTLRGAEVKGESAMQRGRKHGGAVTGAWHAPTATRTSTVARKAKSF